MDALRIERRSALLRIFSGIAGGSIEPLRRPIEVLCEDLRHAFGERAAVSADDAPGNEQRHVGMPVQPHGVMQALERQRSDGLAAHFGRVPEEIAAKHDDRADAVELREVAQWLMRFEAAQQLRRDVGQREHAQRHPGRDEQPDHVRISATMPSARSEMSVCLTVPLQSVFAISTG